MASRSSIVWRVIRVCLLLTALFIAAIGGRRHLFKSHRPTQRGDRPIGCRDRKAVPGDFRIAMYPKHAEVTLHASPAGPVVGTLNRAVLAELAGSPGGRLDRRQCPRRPGVCAGSRLDVSAPAADVNIDWLGNLQVAITRGKSLAGYQYLSYASVHAVEGPAGSTCVTLRMSWSNSADNFVVDVTPTTVSPVQWTIEQAMREFVHGMPALLLGCSRVLRHACDWHSRHHPV